MLVFGCGHAAPLKSTESESLAAVELVCAAQLPPSFFDYVLSRGLADQLRAWRAAPSRLRRRTAEELTRLPHNERALYACERRRGALYVELEIDGTLRFQKSIAPGGLGGDGPARVYERFVVEPGRHLLIARLRDSGRTSGVDYERRVEIQLRPRQNLVFDFHADEGGFIVR